MEYTFPIAPIHIINGEQAFKAGEWHGSKSNKFERTRKCIRPKDKEDVLQGCDFFNQNPRKKHFTIEPGKEKEFKPCMKVFKEAYYTSKDISEQILIWPQKQNNEILRIEPKKHYYQYRDEYINKLNDKSKRSENKVFVKEELNYLSKIGYMLSKNDFANLIEKSKTEEDYRKEKIDQFAPENLNQAFQVKSIDKKLENNTNIQKLLNDNKHIDPLFLIPQLPNEPLKLDNKLNKKVGNKHDYLTQKRENELQELKVKMELIRKICYYFRSTSN